MADLLGTLKRTLSPGGGKTNWTFTMQTVMTSAILACGAMAVTARQFFGQPIQCDAGKVVKIYICITLIYLPPHQFN